MVASIICSRRSPGGPAWRGFTALSPFSYLTCSRPPSGARGAWWRFALRRRPSSPLWCSWGRSSSFACENGPRERSGSCLTSRRRRLVALDRTARRTRCRSTRMRTRLREVGIFGTRHLQLAIDEARHSMHGGYLHLFQGRGSSRVAFRSSLHGSSSKVVAVRAPGSSGKISLHGRTRRLLAVVPCMRKAWRLRHPGVALR